MKSKIGVAFLVITAVSFIANAIAHLSCLYFGPECYAVQLAPTELVESAKNGTYLAPLLNIIGSTIFIVIGLYALSGAGVMRKLPLLKIAIYSVSLLSIVRGILPLQKILRDPGSFSDAHFYYGIGWLVTGLLFLIGFIICNRKANNESISNRQ